HRLDTLVERTVGRHHHSDPRSLAWDGEGTDHLDRRGQCGGVEAALEPLGQPDAAESENGTAVIPPLDLERDRLRQPQLHWPAVRGFDELDIAELDRRGRGWS